MLWKWSLNNDIKEQSKVVSNTYFSIKYYDYIKSYILFEKASYKNYELVLIQTDAHNKPVWLLFSII